MNLLTASRVVRRPMLVCLLAALVSVIGVAAPASGQDADVSIETLLEDFAHYTLIDNRELALAQAAALLNRGLSPEEFAAVVDDFEDPQRFKDALIRAQKARGSGLSDLAAQLLKLYDDGRLRRARAASEISQNIGLLTGGPRARFLAQQRLAAAGEYAVPQLFEALLQRDDVRLQTEARKVLVDLGAQAVIPLCTALPKLDPTAQIPVIGVLSDIRQPTALPFLHEVAETTGSPDVARTIRQAALRIQGGAGPDASLAERFVGLARGYSRESPSLTSFGGEEFQLLWDYDPALTLIPTAIRTEVYHEAMAMRLAERALGYDPRHDGALVLWISANFSREIDSAPGYDNPAYPSSRRDAMHYAMLAGSIVNQQVLAEALETRDTPLARRAIAAIEQTAGGSALFDGGTALTAALTYPNRRVQYEAALALAASSPDQEFRSSNRVTPTLAAAVRSAEELFAVVLSSNAEQQQFLSGTIADLGYSVLPPARSLAEIEQSIAEAPGIDLLVVDLPAGATRSLIELARQRPDLAATPILALATFQASIELGPVYRRDVSVSLVSSGANGDEISSAARQLVAEAVGGAVSPGEAIGYKVRALRVMRDLALERNPVLNVGDASPSLIVSLGREEGPVRANIAEVLSLLRDPFAQRALADAAIAAEGIERVRMLKDLSSSARRFGSMVEPRHVQRIADIALNADDLEANAAAEVLGSLDVVGSDITPLILNPDGAGR